MTPTISGWVLLLTSLVYMACLFALAWWGDRSKFYPHNARYRALTYSFALGVYGSSWTFYGAVGTAKQDGLQYIAGYVGPLVLLGFGLPFFERLVRLAKHQNATSISDLLSARFGRSRRIAVLVTIIALTAIIPYIALQLTAISMSVDVLTGAVPGVAPHWYTDTTLLIALMLAVFSILFGTRVIDATEHHPGMVLAIAAESLFKLVALLLVGVFALTTLDGPHALLTTLRQMPADLKQPSMFFAQAVTAMFAFFCLPRQFHIGIVECADVADVRRARWWFGGYLVLLSIVVIPIVAASLPLDAAGRGAPSADAWVLWLPLTGGQEWLALLAYLGGFSAATGMVIVASVALSTMISNDLVLPMLWRWRGAHAGTGIASPSVILWIRRVAIVGVLLGAYGFFHLAPNAPSLASIGILALAAVAQFAPALIAAVYWPRASRAGVTGGLATGFVIWLYTLLLPAILSDSGSPPEWLIDGPFGLAWLAPRELFGIAMPDAFSHGVAWSLFANVAVMVALSWRFRPALGERLRVAGTRLLDGSAGARGGKLLPGGATVGDLLLLAERLLGAPAARRLLERRSRELRRHVFAAERADLALLQSLERDLSGALGASSARLVLTSALRGVGIELAEMVTLFDEASRKLRFNRELLETMMDNLPQGVCVVNEEMRLVAWNQRYLDLFEYPPEFVFAGKPVEELIYYNAERGWCGPGDPGEHARKRVAYMRAGSAHTSERRRSDGRVIELRGQPLPDGGFVTAFSDVTSHKRTEESLREINETLELRVEERTRQLATAVSQAEQANESKTRFVMAASHDLLQPLGAARLFNAALRSRAGEDSDLRGLVDRVDNSLAAAGELLEDLLDISRLDAGGVRAELTEFDVMELMRSLHEQFAPVAAQRGITLSIAATRMRVRSDLRLVRRVLQNFIGNALRYTQSGSVLMGARRRASGMLVELQVIDTGPGISAENRGAIFEEFRRLDQPSPWGEKGLGLGLSICERIAVILETTLTLRSEPRRGSSFGIFVPRSAGRASVAPIDSAASNILPAAGSPRTRVLCVDDDAATLAGLSGLLTDWNFSVLVAATPEQALAIAAAHPIDIVLADFHLQNRPAGLELLAQLVREAPRSQPRVGALLTADATEKLVAQAAELGFPVLRKPVRPAALRALVAALVDRVARSGQVSSSGAGGAN
ncbi:MAG TPA: PAS domain-containing hybrid sensor histidine kinase/response regulator [Steroidobacteraceae bacterium]|jgi:Na+/proline symporter/signal transduction histidine kinase/CheY-like chemotaxis protein|nr:PAS domain-containing hybrid sensor histidine kinase/response regulator [Steroidobacteraceae bacterium]